MKKYTIEQIEQIIKRSKLSRHEFCRQVEINWGDFYRIMKGKKPISDRINQNISAFLETQETGFIDKIRRFFKGA